MAVVDKLDIRRKQVLIEAIIVDVAVNKNAELGVNWAAWSEDDDTRIPIGSFISPVGGVNLASLPAAVDNPSGAAASGVPTGTTFGVGRIAGEFGRGATEAEIMLSATGEKHLAGEAA